MVDVVKTREQLIYRALKNIGIIEPGEPPSPEDYDTVNELIDPLIAQLAADGIIYIQDANAVETAFYLPLASLLANAAGPDFGSAINQEAKALDERTLRRLVAQSPTYEPLQVDYL